MGAFFRSEEMALAQLFIQPEAAYYSISELGETGTVQFRDLNENVSAFQKKFVNEVRRCDDMLRRLRYIESEIRKDEVAIPEVTELPKAPNPREIIDLEAHLEKTEGDIRELSESAVNLKLNFLELTEMKHVLEKTTAFFNEQDEASGASWSPDIAANGQLSFITGVVNKERVPAFERMLYRISRGNAFLRQSDIQKSLEDPITGVQISKTVFAVFFQGEQLKTRIKKVCVGFRASFYVCPNTQSDRIELEDGVKTRLEDLNLVLNQTNDHRQRVLVSVAKELQNWSVMVKKMKAIYHVLNMFNMDVTKKCLIGECWLPVVDRDKVQKALSDGSKISGSSIPSFLNIINSSEAPPTFNRLNKFTEGFQNLIDAYGVASYREVNPALYTIITFPFLFAVMFGDMGHGMILFLFSLFLVLKEKKFMSQKNMGEIFRIFFGGRYICLLMGIFSIYTGFVYNDVFSKSVKIFPSAWYVNYNASTVLENEFLQLNPDENFEEVYPIGIDPIWQVADNKIIFLNSFKMKLSIIFGVVHMLFGVSLSVVNHIHFKRYYSIFLEFLPQILFLIFLFLWMVVMMFLKWLLFAPNSETKYSSACAPSVLIMFINMILFKSSPVEKGCEEYMFEGQEILQVVLLLMALVCVPIMLFGKPVYIVRKNKQQNAMVDVRNGDVDHPSELQSMSKTESSHDGHNKDKVEIYMDQAIHTIEYVLSTVSHTASYLRLWALSLAHAQLSDVLWKMVLSIPLTLPGYVGVFLLYAFFSFWAMCTVSILVLMEGLSAFLHTLRLHWVEFMSKFYDGNGYPFQPFSFETMVYTEENDEN